MHADIHFYSLLFIAGLAFILPLLINKLKVIRMPIVVAEILAGILFGKSGFDLITNDLWITFLTQLGFAYLMFLSGLEIDVKWVKKLAKPKLGSPNTVLLGLLLFLMVCGFSLGSAAVIHQLGLNINFLLIALLLLSASIGMILPELVAKHLMDRPIGQVLLLFSIFAECASLLILPFVLFSMDASKGIDILLTLGMLVVFLLVYLLGKRFVRPEAFNNPELEHSQLKVRGAFFLILAFVSLSHTINIEIILGGFLAGILFALFFNDTKKEITSKLDAIGYGFLIPIFFIMIGVNFDVSAVLSAKTLVLLPFLILSVFLIRVIPLLFFKKYASWRELIGSGFLISTGLSHIIAISLVAEELHFIDMTTHSIFVVYAMISSWIGPVVYHRLVLSPKSK